MKLFEFIQKKFEILGISSNSSKCTQEKLVMTCLIYGLSTTSSVAFLVFKANTFEEYTSNIYMTSTLIMISIFFVTLAIKKEKLFKLINNVKQFFDESEYFEHFEHFENITYKEGILESMNPSSKEIFDETVRLVEKWSEIGYFIMAKVTPVCWIFPKAITSYYLFTTNAGFEALELPLFF